MTSRFVAFRRSLSVGAAWTLAMAALLLTWTPAASGQEPTVEPGLGNAFAQGFKVDPRSGRLSLGIGFGQALAGHQNTVAQAESRSIDLGIVGDTLAGEGCDGGEPTLPEEDQPQHLTVRSTDDDAGVEKQELEYQVDKRVYADDSPLATASARTAAAGDPAAIEVGATHARTESGLVDGVRVARAVTEVSSVTLAGGAVVLRGLEWRAVYQTAPTEVTEALFAIEGVEVGGQSVPLPDGDPTAALAQANVVLEPLGFRIEPPTSRIASGIAFVDPLRIGVVPSDVREGLLGPIFTAVQPVRQRLFDAIIEADCGNASYILIADIVLGSVTGAGSLNVEVGGVTATSDDLVTTSFLQDLPAAPRLPAGPPPEPLVEHGATSAPRSPQVPSGPAPAPAPAPEAAPVDEAAVAALPRATGSRGGPLLAVGLGGLVLLAALAEADRRRMRRAQRSAPMEVMA